MQFACREARCAGHSPLCGGTSSAASLSARWWFRCGAFRSANNSERSRTHDDVEPRAAAKLEADAADRRGSTSAREIQAFRNLRIRQALIQQAEERQFARGEMRMEDGSTTRGVRHAGHLALESP